jgi:hypothetical protein
VRWGPPGVRVSPPLPLKKKTVCYTLKQIKIKLPVIHSINIEVLKHKSIAFFHLSKKRTLKIKMLGFFYQAKDIRRVKDLNRGHFAKPPDRRIL